MKERRNFGFVSLFIYICTIIEINFFLKGRNMNWNGIGIRLVGVVKKTWFLMKKVFVVRRRAWRNARWYGRIGQLAMYGFLSFLLYLVMVDVNFLWLFGGSPTWSDIKEPAANVASEVYGADGKLLGKYFRENRTPVQYEEINPMMIKTLVVTEDERFYSHHGIDILGLGSAVKDMVMNDKTRGGSTITQQLVKNMFKTRSSYSRGLFGRIPVVSILVAKTKEWITAVKIEGYYRWKYRHEEDAAAAAKRDIVTAYLNTVDFGSNAFGIKTAAKTYFGRTPKELKTEECATLVGMLKATTTYNPKLNPNNSKQRRNVVLDNLYVHDVITKKEKDSLCQIAIDLTRYKVEQGYSGSALYFRQAIADDLSDFLEQNGIDLYGGGLKIYTTIDSKMQEYAEEAVKERMETSQNMFDSHWGTRGEPKKWGRGAEPWRDEHGRIIEDFIPRIVRGTDKYMTLKKRIAKEGMATEVLDSLVLDSLEKDYHSVRVFDYKNGSKRVEMSTADSVRYMQRFLHAGFIAMDAKTGFVKAYVGDVDFNFWKYDKVRAMRQPGSTFKLFDYTAAFEQGWGPCSDSIIDQFVMVKYMEKGEEKRWMPHNADGTFTDAPMTLKCAFARSINSVAVQISQKVGIKRIIETAHKMGIESPIDTIPSACLGSQDVNLQELVDAYCTIINEGDMQSPVLVTRIENQAGDEIYNYKDYQKKNKKAVSYESSFLMIQMLRAGLTEPDATSMALWSWIGGLETDFGGKTGTSNNHSDAWYVGVTPTLVAGAWVGGEHRCVHFRTGKLGSGSKLALPIVGSWFRKTLGDEAFANYKGRFGAPKGEIRRTYSCQTPYVPKEEEVDSLVSDSVKVADGIFDL